MDTFFKKRAPKIAPLFNPFSSVLHQNKALHNFSKRRQHSIVERNIGLEYSPGEFFSLQSSRQICFETTGELKKGKHFRKNNQ